MNEEEYFDAHIGIGPNQSVHMYKYHSIVCSMCSEAMDFKITEGEFDKLKKHLHSETRVDDKEKITCTTIDENKAVVIPSMTFEQLKERYRQGGISIILIPKKVKE